MPPHSGIFGTVDGQSTVRSWSIAEVSSPVAFRASNTKGGTGRNPGIKDWTGSFTAFGSKPAVMPGDFFTFTGYTAPDDDIRDNPGIVYSGQAIVDSIVLTWNWSSGENLGYVVNFGGHLLLSKTTGSYIDNTPLDVPQICGTKAEYGDSGSPISIPHLTQAVLTITAENQTYVNSSTSINGACWTGRKKGNIDMTVALTQESNERGVDGAPDIDEDLELRLFVDATEFWALNWMKVKDYTNITVDRESGAIIAQTINLEWTVWNGIEEGKITQPGEVSDWWPG